MILCVGVHEDPVLKYFVKYLVQQNRGVLFVNQNYLGTKIHMDTRALYLSGHKYFIHDFTGVYNRITCLDPTHENPKRLISQVDFLKYLLDEHFDNVINQPRYCVANSSKPYQLSSLRNEDIMITHSTILANQYFLPEKLVHKSIYKSTSSIRSIVQPVTNEKKNLNEPVLFQKYLRGPNIRVHVLNDRVFPLQILSKKTDYRYDIGPRTFSNVELEPKIKHQCLELAKNAHLRFCGIDLIKCRHHYHVLEINPSPGYKFFEQHMGSNAISHTLLEALSG